MITTGRKFRDRSISMSGKLIMFHRMKSAIATARVIKTFFCNTAYFGVDKSGLYFYRIIDNPYYLKNNI